MILEVDLNDFVREAEHDGMPRAHPLFNVNDVLNATLPPRDLIGHFGVGVGLLRAFKIAAEVLQQGHLLLQLLREVRESELAANILTIGTAALHVIEVEAVRVEANLRGVVEEDSSSLVAKAVAEAILR